MKFIIDYFIYKNGNEINITCEFSDNFPQIKFEVGFYSYKMRN